MDWMCCIYFKGTKITLDLGTPILGAVYKLRLQEEMGRLSKKFNCYDVESVNAGMLQGPY